MLLKCTNNVPIKLAPINKFKNLKINQLKLISDKYKQFCTYKHDDIYIYEYIYNATMKFKYSTEYMQTLIYNKELEHVIIPVNRFMNANENQLYGELWSYLNQEYVINQEYILPIDEFNKIFEYLSKNIPCSLINMKVGKKVIVYFIIRDDDKYIYLRINTNNNTITYIPYTTIKDTTINLSMNTETIYDKFGDPLYILKGNNNSYIYVYSFSIPYISSILENKKEQNNNKKPEDTRTEFDKKYSQYYILLTVKNGKAINIKIKYVIEIPIKEIS